MRRSLFSAAGWLSSGFYRSTNAKPGPKVLKSAILSLLAVWAVHVAGASGDTPLPDSILGFEARRLSGESESLERYRGQVLLIVNTASECGYTPQYEGLEALYEKYRLQGFNILGFPSNDFGGQEPGSEAEIGSFCRENYGVEFPMFSKVKIKGGHPHPLYAYLTGLPQPIGGPVRWNFQKYLVDRSGRVVARYFSAVEPMGSELVAAIDVLLKGAAGAGRKVDELHR